jgi:Rho GTPase-activating protein SYDE
MSAQALATALGPPLMLHSSGVPAEDIDHAQPIAVLKYLLQIWPQPASTGNISGNVARLLQFLMTLHALIPCQKKFTP